MFIPNINIRTDNKTYLEFVSLKKNLGIVKNETLLKKLIESFKEKTTHE